MALLLQSRSVALEVSYHLFSAAVFVASFFFIYEVSVGEWLVRETPNL